MAHNKAIQQTKFTLTNIDEDQTVEQEVDNTIYIKGNHDRCFSINFEDGKLLNVSAFVRFTNLHEVDVPMWDLSQLEDEEMRVAAK